LIEASGLRTIFGNLHGTMVTQMVANLCYE